MANELLRAHRHTMNNRVEIDASRTCGCCACMHIFSPLDIVAWDGLEMSNFDDLESLSGGTALCPNCGTDSVLGDKSGYDIEPGFLGRMNEAWYQRTIIRKPNPKK